jgi:hypothetical protein
MHDFIDNPPRLEARMSGLRSPARLVTAAVTALLVGAFVAGGPVVPVRAAEPAAALAQQNTFVRTHCAVCHNDRANNGGLSLERFDAAVAAPSLTAMMLSKITSGTALATVNVAGHDTAAAALLDRGLKKGAINAAGVGVPPKEFVDELVASFAAKSASASNWSVQRTNHPGSDAGVVTASIVRELPSSVAVSLPADVEARMYRLVLTCNAAANEGSMQLAWSPIPKIGTLSIALDGQPPATYTVEGTERMGNGVGSTTGPAAFVFARFGGTGARIELPKRTLSASGLFAGETVTFPFDQLTKSARDSLAGCFR